MKNLKNQHNKGFTLLELMLVIAIIAAILVLGLSAYEQKLKNGRIETTAIEMQTWLQASLRFYVDYNINERWPVAVGDVDDRYARQIIANNYMQDYQLTNPWGNDSNDYHFKIQPEPDPATISVIEAIEHASDAFTEKISQGCLPWKQSRSNCASERCCVASGLNVTNPS